MDREERRRIFSASMAAGDDAMFDERYQDAAVGYARAIDHAPDSISERQFGAWAWLALAETWVWREQLVDALDVYRDALAAEVAPIVGNPFFHLRVGQCCLAIGDERRAHDNFARALIGGGVELFDHEPPAHLAAIVAVLQPPAAYPSWAATRGHDVAATRELLGGAVASEYLFALLEQRGVVKRLDIRDFFDKT